MGDECNNAEHELTQQQCGSVETNSHESNVNSCTAEDMQHTGKEANVGEQNDAVIDNSVAKTNGRVREDNNGNGCSAPNNLHEEEVELIDYNNSVGSEEEIVSNPIIRSQCVVPIQDRIKF